MTPFVHVLVCLSDQLVQTPNRTQGLMLTAQDLCARGTYALDAIEAQLHSHPNVRTLYRVCH